MKVSSRNYDIGFPRQKVSSSEKTRDWFVRNVDSICNHPRSTAYGSGRSSKHNKQVNYDLYNGTGFNEEDFAHITDPYGNKGKYGDMPVKLQQYNIVRPKIELLKGEEIKRPFFFMARGSGGEVINLRKKKKVDMLLQHFYAELNAKLGLDVPNEEGQVPMPPAQIQKYLDSEYLDPREVTANQLLNFFVKYDNLEEKFNRGWEDALVAGEEIYYISIINGHPSTRVVNPVNIDYELDDDNREIQKAQWVREERWMSPGSILDLWADDLSDEEIDALDRGDYAFYGSHGLGDGLAFFESAPNLADANGSNSRPRNGILVTTVCWRGMEKFGVVSYPDPQTGEWLETLVDDQFSLSMKQKNEGWTLEWSWRTVIYEGTRIGLDIYVGMKPLEYQLGLLPYVGYLYNARNAKSVSLIDLCKHLQYQYMIVMWYIEMAMARNKGNKFIMDVSLMPKTAGMSPEKWQYFFDTFGIAYVQSTDENKGGANRTSFNGITAVDMSSGSEIQQHILMLNKIEEQISIITGVTPQREGQIMASESATNAGRSQMASAAITESWFYIHNQNKKAVLTHLLEVAKVAYADGEDLPYVVDEVYSSLIHVDGEIFPDSEYGVFVSNSSKDFADLQKMEQVASQMAANGNLDMSSYAKLLLSKSITEFQHYIGKAEQRQQEAEQASAQAEQEARMLEVRMKIDQEDKKMLHDSEQKELDRQNKIQIASINTLRGKDGPSDLNTNGVADGIEHAQLALEISAQNAATLAENGKQSIEKAKLQSSHEVAMKKMEADMEKTNLAKDKLERETLMFIREQDQQDKQHQGVEQDRQTKQKEVELKMRAEEKKIQLAKQKVQQDKELEEKRLVLEVQEKEKDRKLQIKLKNKELQTIKLKSKSK